MGAHMLVLGDRLRDRYDITVAAPLGDGAFVEKAIALGLAVKALGDIHSFGHWLRSSGTELLHIHAGI
jgi:hypothetical protein